MARKDIHPKFQKILITCVTCHSEYNTMSTLASEFKTDICSSCHPFYTGKQTFVNRGRVEKFRKKWNK